MIRVGPAGWSYADWEGIVYPRRKGAGFHALRHLSRYVSCVEINSSFYRAPDPNHAARWGECVTNLPEFRFFAKLQNVFTHEPLPPRAEGVDELVAGFRRGIEPLRQTGKLAGLLVQFPHSFRASADATRRLRVIRDGFADTNLVLEVRHRSWYDPEPLATIEELGFSMAHIDLPAASDHPPADAPVVGSTGYLRLHGRNHAAWFDPRAGRDQKYDYLYPPAEIDGLARVAQRIARQTDDVYAITNNHFAGKAVANALDLLITLGDARPWLPSS